MRFFKTTCLVALALTSAAPSTASPLPKADKHKKVSIDEMTNISCVKGCLWSHLSEYPLESKTREEFCITDIFAATLWLNKKVISCMEEQCAEGDWPAIKQESYDWMDSFCGFH